MNLPRHAARRAARRAFTLMEVLVVVAIIVVLASIATVSFRFLTDTKNDAAKMKNGVPSLSLMRSPNSLGSTRMQRAAHMMKPPNVAAIAHSDTSSSDRTSSPGDRSVLINRRCCQKSP